MRCSLLRLKSSLFFLWQDYSSDWSPKDTVRRMQRGKVRTFPPACKRWSVGGPKLLHTSLCSWLFQEQGGDLCWLQHLVGRVLCLSAALSGSRVLGSQQLRSDRRPSRFCGIVLLETSPQLGSDKEVSVPPCPSLPFLLPWAGFIENLEGAGLYFPS